jgi:hypothetical protein
MLHRNQASLGRVMLWIGVIGVLFACVEELCLGRPFLVVTPFFYIV